MTTSTDQGIICRPTQGGRKKKGRVGDPETKKKKWKGKSPGKKDSQKEVEKSSANERGKKEGNSPILLQNKKGQSKTSN